MTLAERDYKAQLGVMLTPTSAWLGKKNGDRQDQWTTVNAVATWPLIDYAHSPAFNAPGGVDAPESFRINYAEPVVFNRGDFIYVKTEAANISYSSFATGSFSGVERPPHDGYVDFSDGVCLVGETNPDTDVLLPGSAVFRWLSPAPYEYITGFVASLPTDGGVVPPTRVAEMALFNDITPPYNPELSSYVMTPILPDQSEVSFTSLNGRQQRVVYASPVYRVSLTFTWSDQGTFSGVLRDAFSRSLVTGSPLLFVPPYFSHDQIPRNGYLLYISTPPDIRQTDQLTWTVNIEGVTQP